MKAIAFLLLCVALGAVLSCARTNITHEQEFWDWFKTNDDLLFNFGKDQEHIFDQLGDQMHRVNPNLTFEFGPKENGHREFVISADGIKEAFPAVEALYAAAPSLPRWKCTKFRPRRKPLDVSYQGVSVPSAQVRVKVDPKGQTANLTVFIPGFAADKNRTYQALSFLLLDGALGEYDVETRVDQISVAAKPNEKEQTYSLEDLPKAFDAALARK
jgi:hypothetical protein